MAKNPDEVLTQALESGRNIKFGRGVTSKTSWVAAALLAVWFAIACKWTNDLALDALLLLAGMVATAFAAWYIHSAQSFAERNPAQAMLEGAEFLEWKRIEAAAKGLPPADELPLIEVKARGRRL
jgi:hypothetical protein